MMSEPVSPVSSPVPELGTTITLSSPAEGASPFIMVARCEKEHSLQLIYDTLERCTQSILKTNSIQESWDFLTEGLRWTNVITSKALHFLCSALGFNQDPPVPIDSEVIIRYVWPGFRIGIPPGQRPQDWEGKSYTGRKETKIAHYSFAAYCRYMTAVIEWAQARQWTSTQLEATIFAENK